MFWLSKHGKRVGEKGEKVSPIEYLILLILRDNPSHGYNIIDNMNALFNDLWKAKTGTIYPILSKMRGRHLIEEELVKSEVGPVKKVYSLSSKGEEFLKLIVKKNILPEVEFMQRYIELTGNIQDNSEYRDFIFQFFDFFTRGKVDSLRADMDSKERRTLVDRLKRLLRFFIGELDAILEEDHSEEELNSEDKHPEEEIESQISA